MKEQAISKINKVGKIGRIISLICRIILGIGFVCTFVGTIAVAMIPKGFITLDGAGSGTLKIDVEKIGQTISAEDKEKLEKGDVPLDLEINDIALNEADVNVTGNVIEFSGKSNSFQIFDLHNMTGGLIAADLTIILTFVTMVFIGRLCKAFEECESPFAQDVITSMKYLAYSLIPWTVVSTVSDVVLYHSERFPINFSVNINMVIVVLLVLALVYIFKYGAVLQQESDETL